jgi:hypothetical protein
VIQVFLLSHGDSTQISFVPQSFLLGQGESLVENFVEAVLKIILRSVASLRLCCEGAVGQTS